MVENPFASLVPKAQPGGNPFASLVPQKSAGGNPFASLVPKAQPGAPEGAFTETAPLPKRDALDAMGSGLGETWNRTKEFGNNLSVDMANERELGHEHIASGLERMQQPGILPKIGGAQEALLGGINKTFAPLTAVWNALGMADPMMTGGEGLHVAGEALKAPEKPVAAPAIKSGEQVFTGPNHAAMREATGLKDPETGFVKPDGQFIGRKEAAAEAIQAGEAAPATTGKGLHSEDLPPEQKPATVAPVVAPQQNPNTSYGKGQARPTLIKRMSAEENEAWHAADEATQQHLRLLADKHEQVQASNPKLATKLRTAFRDALGQVKLRSGQKRAAESKATIAADNERLAKTNAAIEANRAKARKPDAGAHALTADVVDVGGGTHYITVRDPSRINDLGSATTIANVTGTLRDGGKTFYIDNILASGQLSFDKPSKSANTVGPRDVRNILRLIKEKFPTVERVEGERVSGARTGRPEGVSVSAAKTGKGLHSEDLPPQQKPSLVAPVGKDNAAPLPKWAQEFPADRAKTELKPVEQEKPFTAPEAANDAYTGETVLGKPAPKGLSAQANIIPDAPAKDAKLLLRQRIGLGTRDTKQSVAAIQPYEKALNTLDKQGERDFWRYVENRSKENAPPRPSDPHIADAADAWRAAAQQRERKMAAFDDAEHMSFVEDYGPHMYKETARPGEQGVGTGASSFFKQRKIPTFAEAEAQGFTPKYPPAEMMGRYIGMMDKHIALKEAREIAKEAKEIKSAPFGKQPEGWVELKGTRNAFGNALYAPPEWAQAYNRTVDYVPHGGLWGSVRSVANASQALSFVLNSRHFLTVGVEAFGADVARSASHTAAGQFKTAAGAALKSAYAVGHYGFKGNKGLRIYNGLLTSGSKEENEIVSLLTQVNAHSGGKLNYMSATKHGGLYKSYKAGSIPAEFKQYRANIASKASLLGKGAETAKTALTLIGRVMDDIQEPLFGYVIPRVKYGVSMEAMGDWLRLNPMATHAEKLAMAAKISDHVDNVFGELMLDNRFLDAKVREALEVALISVGWNYGFYSELAHGGAATGKSFGKALNIKSPHYDPRAVGLMGMIAGSVIYNAIYQAVKTGTAPSEPMDLISAKTGGKNPDGTPARLAPITNMKEFVDLKYVLDAAARGESGKGAVEYARSKVKPIFTMAIDLLTNSDWKSQPILKPPSLIAGTGSEKAFNVAKEWTGNLLDFAWGGGKPFILNDRRGPNSGISDVERWLGLQPAGKRLANPKGSEESATRRGERNWHAKERGDAKQKALYKGTRG